MAVVGWLLAATSTDLAAYRCASLVRFRWAVSSGFYRGFVGGAVRRTHVLAMAVGWAIAGVPGVRGKMDDRGRASSAYKGCTDLTHWDNLVCHPHLPHHPNPPSPPSLTLPTFTVFFCLRGSLLPYVPPPPLSAPLRGHGFDVHFGRVRRQSGRCRRCCCCSCRGCCHCPSPTGR